MTRFEYYEQMKALARSVRDQYGLKTPRVQRSDLRRIFKDQEVAVELWPPPGAKAFRSLRGAYFDDDLGPTVMIGRGLPLEPAIFTMAHELKHHLADRHLRLSYCDASNINAPIEIGAEVFAAELIFPDQDFRDCMTAMGVQLGQCGKEQIARLKRETQSSLSYTALVKKAEWLGFVPEGSLVGIKWKKLEEQLYGVPLYRRRR